MSEWQTQVVEEQSSILAQEIDAQATVSKFKEELAGNRLKMNASILRKRNLRDQLEVILSAREDMLSLFKSEAIKQYPEFASLSVGEIISKITPQHQLWDLWSPYLKEIKRMNGEIQSSFNQWKSVATEGEEFVKNEFDLIDAYNNFRASSPVPVPPAEVLVADLQAAQSTSIEDDASLIAKVSGIELVSPETQVAIAIEEASFGPTSIMERSVDQALDAQPAMLFGYEKRKVYMAGAAIALFYILFGGRK